MNFKKFLKVVAIIVSLVSFAGVVYYVGKKFIEKKCLDDVDKVKYVSFGSENDEFVSEEVVEKLA